MAGTFLQYMASLWDRMDRQPESRTLSRLIAIEASYLQIPNAEAATAMPDEAEIDRWAGVIVGTKAFERVWDSPKTDDRIASRDAEGLLLDFHAELSGRSRDSIEPQPELERAMERKEPIKAVPDGPTL